MRESLDFKSPVNKAEFYRPFQKNLPEDLKEDSPSQKATQVTQEGAQLKPQSSELTERESQLPPQSQSQLGNDIIDNLNSQINDEEKAKDKYKTADISTMQLFRVVRDNNITLKLTRIRHEPVKRFGKDININSKIKEFYDEVKKYKIEDIICIDETSIKSLQKRNRCYSNKGKRCVIKTQSQEVFKKYTGVFAISVNGIVNWDLYEKGGINTDRLIEFLEHNITSKLRNKLIILDNASAHRNERIKALVNKHNNLLYAVPYQHFTNSIENYFSMLKSRLQKLDGLKYENLKENIQKVISEIPKEKYENIFKGAYERPEKYVPKNKTRKIKKNYK